MKLTKWEVGRILDALAVQIEETERDGRGTKNLERLHAKVSAYAAQTGKRRAPEA